MRPLLLLAGLFVGFMQGPVIQDAAAQLTTEERAVFADCAVSPSASSAWVMRGARPKRTLPTLASPIRRERVQAYAESRGDG